MEETYLRPEEIERRSMELISQELGGRVLDPLQEPVIKRVIHTTADFDYLDALVFSPGAVERGMEALRAGACIVTDTQMAHSGINKRALEGFGGAAYCFISDPDVAEEAARRGVTRAAVSMEKAARMDRTAIFAIGNAPTALFRLCDLMEKGAIRSELVIGAPVGFVNVVEAKERLLTMPCPFIAARGRKGGSNVAAAICNALLYQAGGQR